MRVGMQQKRASERDVSGCSSAPLCEWSRDGLTSSSEQQSLIPLLCRHSNRPYIALALPNARHLRQLQMTAVCMCHRSIPSSQWVVDEHPLSVRCSFSALQLAAPPPPLSQRLSMPTHLLAHA